LNDEERLMIGNLILGARAGRCISAQRYRNASAPEGVVTDWAGQVTNCAPMEHDELRWFGADEWPALSLAHPDYRTVLAMAISTGLVT
jgi:hypothetical protein